MTEGQRPGGTKHKASQTADQREAKETQQKIERILVLKEIVLARKISKPHERRQEEQSEGQDHSVVNVFLVERQFFVPAAITHVIISLDWDHRTGAHTMGARPPASGLHGPRAIPWSAVPVDAPQRS